MADADPHDVALVLADQQFGIGHWVACSHPERPPDDMAVFITSCPLCLTMIHAALTIEPRSGSGIYPGWFQKRLQLAAMLARGSVKFIARRPDQQWRAQHAIRLR